MGTAVKCTSAGKRQQMHFAASFIVPYNRMSCPTNEPDVDFSVLRTLKIDENIRNPLIFLRKMATCSCFAGPIDIKIHASMYFMSICPLAHRI